MSAPTVPHAAVLLRANVQILDSGVTDLPLENFTVLIVLREAICVTAHSVGKKT